MKKSDVVLWLLVCKSRHVALFAEIRGIGGRIIWGQIDASGTLKWSHAGLMEMKSLGL